jgi:hypothetical protein
MSAADDYPALTKFASVGSHFSATIQQARAALAEIDLLRESTALLQAIIDDVLPSVVITKSAVMNIDGRWMRVLIDPKDL